MARKSKQKQTQDYLKLISEDIKDMTTVNHMAAEKIVPTLLTSYNRAIGVGGHPLGCITLVHGPNQVGKSVLAMILAESLRQHDHISFIFDSEYAGEKEWYSAITPKSGYKKIGSFDDLVANVNSMLRNLDEHKRKKNIPKDVGCCFVVDTITKLMPKEILDKMEKEGISRQYSLQSQYISLWSKSITPRLYETNSSLILIVQERKNMNKRTPFDKDWDLPGGKSLQYDNRVRIRVSSSAQVKKGDKVVGVKCNYRVENNKIVGTTFEKACFFTANGKGDVEKGLDLVREAIEEAKQRGVLKQRKNKIAAVFGDEDVFIVDGGWEDVREELMKNQELFGRFVFMLNGSQS